MPQRPACERCVFFVRSSVARGKCRRYPPIVYFDAHAKQPTELWPSVNENWWCGEFRPLEVPKRSEVSEKRT